MPWSLPFAASSTSISPARCSTPLSRTDNNTSGITFFPANSYNAAADWGRSDNDRLHKFDLLASTQPTRVLYSGRCAVALFRQSRSISRPGGDDNHDGILNDRPADVPRNTMAGPGMIDLDLNLSHDFPLSKAKKEAKVILLSP